jgi:hypothetical protein
MDITKAEGALAAAQRIAQDTQSSYEDQKATLEVHEAPYKTKFATAFVQPMAKAMNVQIGSAEMRLIIANDFLACVDGFADYPDPTIEKFKRMLSNYEQVVIE